MRRLGYARQILHDAAVVTATGGELECFNKNNGAYTVVTFQVTGISGDTIDFQGTIDNTNWGAIRVTPLATGTVATSTTVDGLFQVTVTGLLKVRANLTRVSGTVTVIAVAVAA